MKEILDVFDENYHKIGTEDREEVHRKGLWHQTVHCWIIVQSAAGTWICLQQRAADKKEFPSLFDISAAGHVEAGEDIETAALREIREEIGLLLEPEDLHAAGYIKDSIHIGSLKDNEFCRLFFYKTAAPLDLKPGEEVQDAARVLLSELEKLITGEKKEIKAESVLSGKSFLLSKRDLCPHEENYYRHILKAAQGF
ncbi:NUDIX hydrolase [Bacillus massiliglaciei]|uniref:NUDIX hydrolase n=1 Tax=Bacillus massiliglaciei TaxID=1816693 RepID=UPI000DA633C9|nr:NUDIX domain-containing protein [Bacillus massiliglaciei]